MPRSLTSQQQGNISLTELAQTISDDTGGFQNYLDRSLRLPERNGGNVELKVHTERFNNPLTAKGNSQNAVQLVYDSLQREVGQHAAELLWDRNKMENGRVTVGQIKDLHDSVKNFHQAQAVIRGQMNDWDQRRQQNAIPLAAPSLDALTAAPVAQLKVSAQGSGGAILTPSGVAKVEHSAMGRGAYETAQVAAEAFGMNSPDCPLQFTPVALYTDPASLQAAHQTLSAFKATPAGANNHLVDRHLQTLDPTSPKAGDAGVSVAARVDGRPLNRLNIEEKIALFQGGQLAADIGKASVLCPVLGLNDHVGPNGNGKLGPGFFAAGQQNISNLMLDNQTGRLVAIDYAPTAKGTITAQGMSNGYGAAGPDNAVASLAAFVTRAAESPEAYEEAVTQMLARNGTVCPLAGTMTAFLKPDDADGDSYLSHEEKLAFDLHVTPEQQRAFAEQMLKGAVEGLSYLQQHQQELAQAVENSSRRCGMTEGYRRNFLQPQEMANLHMGLEGMNFAHLRANLAAVSQGQAAPNVLQAPSFKAPSLYSLEVLAEQAMEGAGLKPHLDEFNASNGHGLHITPEQMITPELKAKIEGKVKKSLEEGRTADACTEARAMLDEAMRGKLAVVKTINARADLGANRPFALEAALKNDYASPEAFERSYFRGAAPAEAKVDFTHQADTSRMQLASPSVGKALESLSKPLPYNAATYDPAGYFDEADAGKSGERVDFQLNAAVLGTAMSGLPQEQAATRQALAQRMAGYQMKFASVNSAATLQTQVNPLQAGDFDNYIRSTGSNLGDHLRKQLAASLLPVNDSPSDVNDNSRNILPVTDSRFMEVLKRSRSMEDQSAVVTWGEEDFSRIYENLEKGEEVFLDITPFMAGTLHGHEAGETKEAIMVANEFMHDALHAGVSDYLLSKPGFEDLAADDKMAATNDLLAKMEKNLALGAMVQVGEQHALYTAPLGSRSGPPGNERFKEGVTSKGNFERLTHQAAHNGFTMGPQHLLDQWSRGAPTPEHMLERMNLMTNGAMTKGISAVTLPEDTSRLARFDNTQDFLDTQIFKDFKALGQDSNAPPYVRISAAATASMMEGLQEMKLHESFGDQGLDPVLQMTYNRMQGAMQKAVAAADDPARFNDYMRQVELVHEQLANTLAVAKPYSQEQFSQVMRDATDLMPDGFREDIQPQFALKNSGLRALSSTLTGVEALREGRKLNIAMQKDCYYESGFAVEEAAKHRHLTLDGDKLDATTGDMVGEKLDMYVAEFHHNISLDREEYHAEDVTAQVDRLFKLGLVSDKFTVALDTTIATTDAQEIKAFLDHNKDRIAEGKLNVVMYRSGQKFDLMGMDNYNGGVMAVVNNGQAFASFNKATQEGRGVDNLGDLSVQGFTMMQKHAQQPLNDYRSAAMRATAALGSPRSDDNPLGLPPAMILNGSNRGDAMIQIARNTDDRAVFLDLRNPWLEKGTAEAEGFNNSMASLLTQMSQDNPGEYHIEGRASFGFMHSNVTVIGGDKFRFNPGLEDDASLARYRDTLVAANDVFMQNKADYPAVDDFNSINSKLLGNLDATSTLVRQQMQVNAGQPLTPDQKLEAAQILSKAGNQRGAARMLVSLGQEQNLTPAQTQSMAALSRDLQGKLQQSPRHDVGGLKKEDLFVMHESASQVRAMLRQGGDVQPQEFFAKLGNARGASLSLGQQGADQRLTSLLASDFKNIPPTQLAAVSRNANAMADRLPDNDPQKALLQTVSKLASQDLMISLAATDVGKTMTPQEIIEAADNGGFQTERQISEQFLGIANARQRPVGENDPTPRTTLGDIYATFEHHQNGVQPGADPGGDRIISLDGDAPEERLMKAIVGHGVEHMDDMQAIFADPAVSGELKKMIGEMPPEQRTLYSGSSVNAMHQMVERGLRSAHISYKEMIEDAQKKKPAKFAKAAAEFEGKLNNLMQETRFVGDLLTKPENLARLPAQYRDDLRKFGENAKAIGQELARPGGFGQSAMNFASLATSKPETVMEQTCDVQLAQMLRLPPAPQPPLEGERLQQDAELFAPVPNYPAPTPPEMSKKPKANIAAKDRDAGEGMAVMPQQEKDGPNIILPDAKKPSVPEIKRPQPASRGTLSDEQIEKAISDLFPHEKVAADVQAGHVPNYRNLAIDISHALVDTNMADRQAIEARMIEKREIQPLRARIDELEAELDALEKTPGIEAGDERIEAKRAELNDMYEGLDNWEVRVETLQRALALDDRKDRLAAINAEHAAEQQALEGVDKLNQVQFEPGLDEQAIQRRHPRLLAASGVAAESIAKIQGGLKPNNSDFTPNSLSQQIQTSYKNTYGAQYRSPSPQNRKDPIPDEIKPVLAEMKPTIDKVNAIQKQIRDLDSARDQMILDHGARFGKEPSLIEDDVLRQRVETDQQAIQQAEQVILECDNQLAALQNPGPVAEAAANGHSSVEQAREHYEGQKKQATQQLNYAQNDLSAALVNAGQSSVNQSPEANAILDQIDALRQQQVHILREYKETAVAQAAAIMPEMFAEQAFPKWLNAAPSGHDVKSAMKQSAATENNIGTRLKVAELDLRRKNGQASFQMYQQNVQMAAQEFKMRPQIIEDPAVREQGIALKEEMAEVQAKIAHYDNELAKLDRGTAGARLRSLASGGVERRKEFYEQKKAAVVEQLQSLDHQLDQVALDAVSDSTKMDLLQDAKALAEAKNNTKIRNAQPGDKIIVEGNKEGQGARKPSVAEVLKRSHSMPNLSGHQPQVASNQPKGQQLDKEGAEHKSLRASGSWKSSRPGSQSGGGMKQS
ncbi:MAG: hypothetical protein JNN17_13200 [Verrucomicrobiaceae bacterium]|nr:hypothetical protein [Verrucomicrobiaceae bacterium]